jgi:mannosyltransferase OCH1-like enzyme
MYILLYIYLYIIMINLVNKKDLAKRQKELIDKIIKTKQEAIDKYNVEFRKIKLYNEMNIKFDIKQNYNSIIPLNFYTCWHTKDLPPLMKANYDQLVSQNPELSFYLYDENECRNFIKNNFDLDVLNAYNSLIPCSYKSDLWRFCVLYINGGIYMDIKYKCVNDFKLIALTEQEYFVRDRPINTTYTALIVVKPQNPIMLKCINQIVTNVREQYYGLNPLYPTGPGLLGTFFSQEDFTDMKIYFTDTKTTNFSQEYMVYKNTIILTYYEEYRNEQKQYQKNKNYTQLWNERKIYN